MNIINTIYLANKNYIFHIIMGNKIGNNHQQKLHHNIINSVLIIQAPYFNCKKKSNFYLVFDILNYFFVMILELYWVVNS